MTRLGAERHPQTIGTPPSVAGSDSRGDSSRRADRADRPVQRGRLVDFEVAEFNKKVYTRAFNRAVAEAIALECPPDQPGKTLLFAARDDHADILVEELRDALRAEYGPQPHDLVEKITGSVDKPLDRIKAFKNDPRPKYVVTVDLLTTGIDVPHIVNLVFVRRVNSRILYDQMIGRATRRADDIGKEYFRIFDAVDIYANLQEVSDMRPVVVDPALSFATLVNDLKRAPTEEDARHVRDQIVVKLRQRIKYIGDERRQILEAVLGPLDTLADRLKGPRPRKPRHFAQNPSLAAALDAGRVTGRRPAEGTPKESTMPAAPFTGRGPMLACGRGDPVATRGQIHVR